MQTLRERNTYTPTDIPHVRSNCDSRLKSPEGRGRAASLKTSPNTPDAALTAREQAGQALRVPAVYVLNKRGNSLSQNIYNRRKENAFLRQHKAVDFLR